MSNELINLIKSLSIVEIISNYITLNKKGANYLGICPFHQDSKPSLTVNEDKKIFKCFACGVSGDSIGFVSKIDNISYHQGILKIAEKYNLDSNLINKYKKYEHQDFKKQKIYLINKKYLEFCKTFLLQSKNKFPSVYEYIQKRKIDDEIINHFKLGYNPSNENTLYELLTNERGKFINLDKNEIFTRQEVIDANLAIISQNGNILDTFRNRLIFSIKNENNEIVGFSGRSIETSDIKYINTSKTDIFNKGEILYNFNNIKLNNDISQLFIVEGFMDVIALYKSNFKNVVATMGTSFTKKHLDLIKSQKNINSVILAFDNDNAGLLATIKTGELIASNINTFVVKQYNPQYKDFDELLNSTNEENVRSILNKQQHFSIFYINYLIKTLPNESESDKQTFISKCLDILKKYSSSIYANEYIQLISSFTNYDKETINKKITSVIKQKYSNNVNQALIEQGNISYLINKNLSIFKNMTKRLIMACLVHLDTVKIIKSKYDFYGNKTISKIFNQIYEDFRELLNIISDFRITYPNKNNLTVNDQETILTFMKQYINSIDTSKSWKTILECLQENEYIHIRYEYNENNLNNTIKTCLKSDLEIRKQLLIYQFSNNENNNLKVDELLNKINEYSKKIMLLEQLEKK